MPDPEGQLFADMVAGFDSRAITPRILVDAAGEWAYVYVQQGGALRATRVALTGEVRVEPLTDVNESVVPVGIDGARLLAIRTSHTRPADLVVVDTKTGQLQAVTGLNGTWLTGLPFDVHHLTYPTTDGHTEIEGWYLAPRDGTGPYPTVLHIHGGPFAVHGEIFNVDNLLLAAAGYGVLMVNFRGSSGYGDAHAEMLIGDWGRYDLADVLQAVDVAVEQGLADSTRVASFGLSSGGYLTSWLLTHSDRFRAGISECPVSDWTGMLGSDLPALVAASMDSSPGRPGVPRRRTSGSFQRKSNDELRLARRWRAGQVPHARRRARIAGCVAADHGGYGWLSLSRYHRGAEPWSARGMPEVSAGSSARIFQPPKAVSISSRLAPGGRGPRRAWWKASIKSVASGAAAAVTQSAIACRPGPGRWWKQPTSRKKSAGAPMSPARSAVTSPEPDRIRHRVKTAHRLSPVVLVVTGRPGPVLDAGVVLLPGEVVGQRPELPEYGDVVADG